MNITHKLGELYAHYLTKENQKNTEERYVGKEHFYHASGSGKCSRQLYFQTVEQVPKTNLPNAAASRVMRLGTLVHQDFEKSILLYNNIYNNIINSNTNNKDITKKIETKSNNKPVYETEGEIIIDELSVRGFYDIVQNDGLGVILYDLKTAHHYSFQKLFNKEKSYPMKHHELQLSTYGYGVKEKYGRLDGMYLLYYNKNTSVMRYKQVPLSMLNSAYMFWANINKQHSVGLPNFEDGVSPVMKWECDYCNYISHCKPPTGYGKNSHKYTLTKGETDE